MKRVRSIISLAVLTAVLLSALPAPSASVSANSGIVVNTHQDSFSLNNDGICSLREAITIANQGLSSAYGCSGGSGGTNTITFAGNYTITLGSELPAVTSSIVIQGNGASNTIIQANATANTATYRVFLVTTGSLTLDGLTVRHGRCNGSCIHSQLSGGGIYNAGTLTVSNTTISANSASNGGGIFNRGNVALINVTFSGNSAGYGGGMRNFASSPTLTSVTFSGNSADYGGGMSNEASHPTLTNATFSANSAQNGGGMYNFSSNPTLTNVTFRGNSASLIGGGIHNHQSSPTLKNVIIANSINGDCISISGSLNIASTNNLITTSDTSCGLIHAVNGNIIGQNPSLGPLANNGGFTQTHALSAGSPAINAGTNTGCPAADQRGMTRPQGSHCDIGAYEKLQTFADVPFNAFGWAQIEAVYNAGITGGCTTFPLNYCPNNTVTRAQMAIFLLRGKHGSSYTPPPVGDSTGFADVPVNAFAAAWIKQLAAEGITGGCGNGNYCPNNTVTRSQMAIFLLRAKYSSSYTPPPATGGQFLDVPSGAFAAAWIEKLVADGITGGCGGGNYCPNNPVTRSQMAIFLQRTFNLPMP